MQYGGTQAKKIVAMVCENTDWHGYGTYGFGDHISIMVV